MKEYSFQITQKQYNYLLPVFGLSAPGRTRLMMKSAYGRQSYYFIGTEDDYKDMLNRCKYLK